MRAILILAILVVVALGGWLLVGRDDPETVVVETPATPSVAVEPEAEPEAEAEEAADAVTEAVEGAVEQANEAIDAAAGAATEAVTEALGEGSEAANAAAEAIGTLTDQARDAVADVAGQATEAAGEAVPASEGDATPEALTEEGFDAAELRRLVDESDLGMAGKLAAEVLIDQAERNPESRAAALTQLREALGL